MQLSKGMQVEVKISDMAFGGAGVGRYAMPDGTELVVFIEGATPGDLVLASFTKLKKNFAEARLVRVISPSPTRITPRCKHFGVCGGCALQFLTYEDQVRWKEKIVSESLMRLGGFEKIPLEPIIGCEDAWFYRNKMEYSFGEKNGLVLGLHEKKSFRYIFDLEECFLSSPVSVDILKWVRAWARNKKLSACDPQSGKGLLKTLTVREGKNTGEFLVNIAVADEKLAHEKEFAEELVRKFPQVVSVYRTSVIVRRGFKTVIQEVLLKGVPTIKETLTVPTSPATTLHFDILPQAFFQPNTRQAQLLYGKVLEYGLALKPSYVLDLFCGTGTIGMFFAAAGVSGIGVDLNESAIEVAKQNAARNELKNISFYCGDVFKLLTPTTLGHSNFSSSLVITDPPRAGIMPKALEKLIGLKIPHWIYVSCNPTTLARDLEIICKNGYTLDRVQPVDMFPQTYHVETVCMLSLK